MSPDCSVVLSVRRGRPDDCRLFWEWANDPEVRSSSFNSEPIAWTDHFRWFRARLNGPRYRIFVVTEEDGTPVGQVRFERPADAAREAEVHISVAASHRGLGLGAEVLRLACREYQREIHVPLVAHVRPTNERSMKMFRRVGFVQRGPVTVRGFEAIRWDLRFDSDGV